MTLHTLRDRAVSVLLEGQRSNGGWSGFNHGGPMSTALVVVALATVKALSARDAQLAQQWLLDQQLDDGSWALNPLDQTSSLDATGSAVAGLLMSGMTPDDGPVRRGRDAVEKLGGEVGMQPQVQVMWVLSGLMDGRALEPASMTLEAVPGYARFLGTRFGMVVMAMAHLLPVIITSLRRGAPLRPSASRPLEALAIWNVTRYIETHQNPDGSWASVSLGTAMVIITGHCLGWGLDHPVMQRSVTSLEHLTERAPSTLQVFPFSSEVWNTALSLPALWRSGLSVHDPVSRAGLDYLLQQQGQLLLPKDWQNPSRKTVRFGGWAYEHNNALGTDCDTTSMVLHALGEARALGARGLDQAIARGRAWLLGMRNADGGWPAFTHGQRSKPPGPLYVHPLKMPDTFLEKIAYLWRPPLELAAPSTASLTARAVRGLLSTGDTLKTPHVVEALSFIERQATPGNGAWWGRWAVNYVPASAFVIATFAAAKIPMAATGVSRGLRFLLEHQHADGGWGEDMSTYAHPAKAGDGPSDVTPTALVTLALLEAGVDERDAVERGMAFLAERASPEGWLADQSALYVLSLPDATYVNLYGTQAYAVQALSTYLGSG